VSQWFKACDARLRDDERLQTAKSPIRLNRTRDYTVFRVRIVGLQPRTTYYYTVASIEANGAMDAMHSPVKSFTTP
jgi:Purple acid Phosphatase, N-terminal domain